MKTPSPLTSLSLAVIVVSTAGVSRANAAAISFNARGGTGTAMLAAETAGAPGANFANWNDMNSTQATAGQAITGSLGAGSVVDSSGTILAATTISWVGTGVATASGAGTNDAKMWSSEWDLFDSASNIAASDMRFTVTSVPYALYDVYYYVDDAANAAIRGGNVVANGVTESITMFNATTNGYTEVNSPFSWISGTTGVGSYLRIQGLSGDLTLDIFSRNPTTPRLRMSGFQIVEVPEPSAAFLGVFGGVLLLRRRR